MAQGVRWIDGKEFLLAGRGPKERMLSEAATMRERYRFVRVVPAHPFSPKFVRDALDDYMVYVHGAK